MIVSQENDPNKTISTEERADGWRVFLVAQFMLQAAEAKQQNPGENEQAGTQGMPSWKQAT